MAVRAMGNVGYPWRADVLIAVLEDPDDPMREEAIRALENISGEIHGDDPDGWQEWIRSLPTNVVMHKE